MKILKSIILLSSFSVIYASTPPIDVEGQRFDQDLCVKQRLKECLAICSQTQNNCASVCEETVKNQCRYAGE